MHIVPEHRQSLETRETILECSLQQPSLPWIRNQHRPNLCQRAHVIRCRPSHHHCRRISACPSSISQWAHRSRASERCNQRFRVFWSSKGIKMWGTRNLRLYWIWRDWCRVMKCFKVLILTSLSLSIHHTYKRYVLSYYRQDDPAPELVRTGFFSRIQIVYNTKHVYNEYI